MNPVNYSKWRFLLKLIKFKCMNVIEGITVLPFQEGISETVFSTLKPFPIRICHIAYAPYLFQLQSQTECGVWMPRRNSKLLIQVPSSYFVNK